ncbi:unnamed protein product, partial [Candidula unifasciata]
MLDFFTIFSKGGIVLWCFQGTSQLFTTSVNALIKSVILQERTGNNTFSHESLLLKYKLDNEFELIFVVAYQNILQLSYVDKFLTDIQLEFRERYKNVLLNSAYCNHNFEDFTGCFHSLLKEREEDSRKEQMAGRKMRTFEDSQKSKKTVSSMIENKKDEKKLTKGKENKVPKGKATEPPVTSKASPKVTSAPPSSPQVTTSAPTTNGDGGLDEETRQRNLQKLLMRGKKPGNTVTDKSPEPPKRKGKQGTKWSKEGTAKDMPELNYGTDTGADAPMITQDEIKLVGQMSGQLPDIETNDDEDDDDYEEEKVVQQKSKAASKSSSGGVFGLFRGLVGSKTLTADDLRPVLEKMKDHLI